MLRLLLFVAFILCALALIKRGLARHAVGRRRSGRTAISGMVKCERCGVYLLSEEAVHAGHRVYCSVKHRDAVHRMERS